MSSSSQSDSETERPPPGDLAASLASIVGAEHVLTGPAELDRYSADALTPYRAYYADAAFDRLADVVARPADTAQVAQIVALAQSTAVPLIPYGGGTGVMGGILPVQGGIILDLGRLNRGADSRLRPCPQARTEGGPAPAPGLQPRQAGP